MRFFRHYIPLIALLAVLSLTVVWTMPRPTVASPLTNPSGAPYTKLGVYQGVIGIITSGESMEIGNAGTDIGSTGSLYLRPGGIAAVNAPRVFSNGGSAALSVGTGKVCLNPSGSANLGAYNCYSSWVSGGDSFWTLTGSQLSLTTVTPQTDLVRFGSVDSPIELGTTHQPIPRRAVDIYAAAGTSPALSTAGRLLSGYDAALRDGEYDTSYNLVAPYNGSLTVSGKLIIQSHQGLLINSPSYFSTVPWSAANKLWLLPGGGLDTTKLGGGLSQIDADTFDAAAVLSFSTDHNLYWRYVGGINAYRLCLNADIPPPNNGLCTGGTNPGIPCSTSSSGQCLGGGTCTAMCLLQQDICQASSSLPKRCADTSNNTISQCKNGTNNGTVCTSDAECTGGGTCSSSCVTSADCRTDNYCVQGKLKTFGINASSCALIDSCATACSGDILCNGHGLCSQNWGTTARADDSKDFGCTYTTLGGVTYFTRICECRLTVDTPYWKEVSSNGSAPICTPAFVP